MPRKPTEQVWVERIRELVAENPKRPVTEIERILEQEGARQDPPRSDSPRGNTIRRIRAAFTESERESFRPAFWPESFGATGLPVDAVPAFFELWRTIDRQPSVRLVRAFWSVCQALGTEELYTWAKYRMALFLQMDPRSVESDIRTKNFQKYLLEPLPDETGTTTTKPRLGIRIEAQTEEELLAKAENALGKLSPEVKAQILASTRRETRG